MVKQQYLGMENEKDHVYRVHFGSNSCSDSYESDSNDSDESCDGKPPPQSYSNVVKISDPVKPRCETLNEDNGEEWTNPILQSVQSNKNITKQQIDSLQQSLLKSVTSKYCEACGQKIPNLIYKSESDKLTSSNQHADCDFLQDFNESNTFEDFGISDIFFCDKKYVQKYVETNADIISISAMPQFKKTVSFFNKKKEKNIRFENILQLHSVIKNEQNVSFGAFFIPELIQKSKNNISTKKEESSSVEKQKLDKIMSNNKKQCTESSSKNFGNKFNKQIQFENFIPSKILSQIRTFEKKQTSDFNAPSKRKKRRKLKISSSTIDKVDKINNCVAKQTLDKPFDLRDFPELSSVYGKSKTSKAIEHNISSNVKNGIKIDEMEATLSNKTESLLLSPQSETINKIQNCSKDNIRLETFLDQIYSRRNYVHSIKSLKSGTEIGDENNENIEQLPSEYADKKSSLFKYNAKIIIDEQNELMNSVCKHHTEESFAQGENKESGQVEANKNNIRPNNVEKEICHKTDNKNKINVIESKYSCTTKVGPIENKTKKGKKRKQKSCKPDSVDFAFELPYIEHTIQNKSELQSSAAGIDISSNSEVNHSEQVNKNMNLPLHFQESNSSSNDIGQTKDENGKNIYNESTFETSSCFSRLDKDAETKFKIIREEAKRNVNSGKQNTKQNVDLPGTVHDPDLEKLSENKSGYRNNVTESITQLPLTSTHTQIIHEQIVLTSMNKYHVETSDQEKNVDSSQVKDSRNLLLENNDEEIATNMYVYNTCYKKPFVTNEISSTYSCNTNLTANESNPKKAKKSRSKKKKQTNSNPNSVTPSTLNLQFLNRENNRQEKFVNSVLTTLQEFDVKKVDISHSVDKQVTEDGNTLFEIDGASNAETKNLDELDECNNFFHDLNFMSDAQFYQNGRGVNRFQQNEETICSYEDESTSETCELPSRIPIKYSDENIELLMGNEKNVIVNNKRQENKSDFMDPPENIEKWAGKKLYYTYNFTEIKKQLASKSTYNQSRVPIVPFEEQKDVLRSIIGKLYGAESLEPGKTDESSKIAEIGKIGPEMNNDAKLCAYNADYIKSFILNEVQSTHLGNSKAKTKTKQTKSKKKKQNTNSYLTKESDSKVSIAVNYSNDKSDIFNSFLGSNILVDIDNSSNAEINHLAEINENVNLVLPLNELISKAEKEIISTILNHIGENVCHFEEDTLETNEGTSQYFNIKMNKEDEKTNESNRKVNSEKNHEFLNLPSTIVGQPYITNVTERRWGCNFNIIDNVGLQILKDNGSPTYKPIAENISDKQNVLINKIYNYNQLNHTLDKVESNEYHQVAINQNILVENNDEEEVHGNNFSCNTDITNQRADEGKIKKNKSKKRKKKLKQGSDNPVVNIIHPTYKEKFILEKSTTNLRNISESNTEVVTNTLSKNKSDDTNGKLSIEDEKNNHAFMNQQTVQEHDVTDILNKNKGSPVCDIEYVYNQEQNSAYKTWAKEVKLENTNIAWNSVPKHGLDEMPVPNETIPLILKRMNLETNDNGQLSLQHSGMHAAISDDRSEHISQIPCSESVCKLNSNFDTDINNQVKQECLDIFQAFTTLKPKKVMGEEVSERDFSITVLKNSAEKTEERLSPFFNESSCLDFVEPLRNEEFASEFHSHNEYSLSLDQERETLFKGNNGIKSFSSTPPKINSTLSDFNKTCIIS